MHDQHATGNDFFKCDFCLRPWADDRPMVEGHKGSLICAKCLTAGYADVVLAAQGDGERKALCVMCLESRDEPKWASPMHEARICRRCLKQSAGVLEKDPDFGWTRPVQTSGPGGSA